LSLEPANGNMTQSNAMQWTSKTSQPEPSKEEVDQLLTDESESANGRTVEVEVYCRMTTAAGGPNTHAQIFQGCPQLEAGLYLSDRTW